VMDYTVVGDTVNVAKRLQEFAKGGEVLLSEATLARAGGVEAEQLPSVELAGRSEPVTPYRLRLKGGGA
jgi:adenylate cyclase